MAFRLLCAVVIVWMSIQLPMSTAQIPIVTPSFHDSPTRAAVTTTATTAEQTTQAVTDPQTQAVTDIQTQAVTDPQTQAVTDTATTPPVSPTTQPQSNPVTDQTTCLPTTPPPCPTKCSCNIQTQTVDCQKAALTSIPTDLPEYTSTLYLNENNFNILQRGTFIHLPNLAALHLISCGIQSIANGAFNGLGRLRFLSLRANHITSVEGVLQGMPELRVLDLEQNRLGILSESALRDLPKLCSLSVGNNNQLQEIGSGTFQFTPLLTSLSISNCNLQSIPVMVFQPLPDLIRLDLSGNNIVEIPPAALEGLESLQYLMLSSMSLSQIDDMAFIGLSKLVTLDLSHNNLENVDKEIFIPVSATLQTLILTGSPWDCNCRMSQFFDWLKTTQIDYFSASWTCFSPDRLMGRPVYTISAEDFACIPIFYKKPSSMGIPFAVFSFFECRAYGDPAPQIEWYRPDGTLITATSTVQNIYTIIDSTVLVIQSAEETDGGNYNCTATNSNGAVSTIFSLDITDIPRTASEPTSVVATTTLSVETPECAFAPLDVKVGEFSDTEIQMQWSMYNNPLILNYIVETTEFGQEESMTKLVSKENTTFLVSGLKPATNYIICVSVLLPMCPSITTFNQCKQVTTGGMLDDGIAALEVKHRNEIIGTALAVFLGTLFILASIFVILWQYRKPKSYTKYDFKTTPNSAQFADLDGVAGYGESSRNEELLNQQIRFNGSLNRGAMLTDNHEAEVYSIPPDAYPVYSVPKGKGKGKGRHKEKRGSQTPLVDMELDRRNSGYMVPSLTKSKKESGFEAMVVDRPGTLSPTDHKADMGEAKHHYEEVDSQKCDCDPVVHGIIESNGHIHNTAPPPPPPHGRTQDYQNNILFSPIEGVPQSIANGDASREAIMTV